MNKSINGTMNGWMDVRMNELQKNFSVYLGVSISNLKRILIHTSRYIIHVTKNKDNTYDTKRPFIFTLLTKIIRTKE